MVCSICTCGDSDKRRWDIRTDILRYIYISAEYLFNISSPDMMFPKRQKLNPCNDKNQQQANFQSRVTTATSTSISTPTPHEWPQCSPSQAGDTAPFHSSPLGSGSWYQDGFTHDPGYLASQEELRCMLFSIAQSAVPGSSGSDVDFCGGGTRLSSSGVMKEALSNRRRIGYLKNYVGEVAPWVGFSQLL